MSNLSNIQTKSLVLQPEISMDEDFVSAPLNVSAFNGYYLQMAITGTGDNSGTAVLQTQITAADGDDPSDLDEDLWVDYPDSSKTVVGTETVIAWEVTIEKHQWVRVSWDYDAGSGHSATILAYLKTTSGR